MVEIIADTVEEAEILQQFKEAVGDLKVDDGVLIRFLRARTYDINKAEEMIRSAYQWREEMGIDNHQKWEFPEYYNREIAYNYFGKDYEGAPILYVPVGKWNGIELVNNGEGEDLLRWAFSMLEQAVQTVKEHGSKGNAIIDLEGLSYSQVTHIQSLKLFYQGCQKVEMCYPELIKSVTIINAPWVFTLGFNFIKGIISKSTMDKIKIFGSNKEEWMADLLERIPEESIVPELRKDFNGN